MTNSPLLGVPPWTVSVRDVGPGDREVVFTAFGRTRTGDVVYYRGRTRFLPGQRKIVPVFLSRTCVGFLQQQDQSCELSQSNCCATGTSCRAGACVDEFIDPNTLPDFSDELAMARLDGGATLDAQISDASRDAAMDTEMPTDTHVDAREVSTDTNVDARDASDAGDANDVRVDAANDATSDAADASDAGDGRR